MVATAAILAPCAGAFERHVLHFGSLENGVDVSNLRNNLVEQLWETRGSRLPLRGVIGLWIGSGSLWNLDRPRQRSPTGRGPRAVSAAVSLIRKKRGYYGQGFDLRFRLRQLDFFQPENFVSVLHKVNTFGELRSIR